MPFGNCSQGSPNAAAALSIWLGRNAQPQGHSVDDFNTAAAQAVMPGKLARIWHHQDAFLAPGDYQHPMLAKFRSVTGGVPWEEFTVDSHWQLADFNAGVNPVMSYSNGQPAILEQIAGQRTGAGVHDANFRRSHRPPICGICWSSAADIGPFSCFSTKRCCTWSAAAKSA